MSRFVVVCGLAFAMSWFGPSAIAQQGIPPEQLKKIKAATVFVKVSKGNLQASGSGFVVYSTADYGLIVTNEHVTNPKDEEVDDDDRFSPFPPRFGMLPPRFGARPFVPPAAITVTIVFNSGETTEWSVPGEVLYRNTGDDLSVVKVKATRPMPLPISLDSNDKIPETTQVYVCGFPFGSALAQGGKNPEISIGVASVSSNRLDKAGNVTAVQLNGALNPGNSGGPVLTQEGKLVGVAVKTILAAGIGIAIPPRVVTRFMRPQSMEFTTLWIEDKGAPLMVASMSVANPYTNVKNVKLFIAPATQDKTPEDVSKLPNATEVMLKVTGEGVLRTESRITPPKSANFWYQLSWTAEGQAPVTGPGLGVVYKLSSVPPAPPVAKVTPSTRPNPSTRPTPRSAPKELLGADGKKLGTFGTKLPKMPTGQISLTALDNNPESFAGKDVTFDLMCAGVRATGWGNGPSLNCQHESGATMHKLDIVIDESLLTLLTPFPSSPAFPVRVKARLKESGQRSWSPMIVQELSPLGVDGQPLTTYKRGEKVTEKPVEKSAPGEATQISDFDVFRVTPAETLGKKYKATISVHNIFDARLTFPPNPAQLKQLWIQDTNGRGIFYPKLYCTRPFSDDLQEQMDKLKTSTVAVEVTFQVVRAERFAKCDAVVLELSVLDNDFKTKVWTSKDTYFDQSQQPAVVEKPKATPTQPAPAKIIPSSPPPPAPRPAVVRPETNLPNPFRPENEPPEPTRPEPKRRVEPSNPPPPVVEQRQPIVDAFDPQPQPAPVVAAPQATPVAATNEPIADAPRLSLPLAVTIGVVAMTILILGLVWANNVFGSKGKNRKYDRDDDDDDDDPRPKRSPPKPSRFDDSRDRRSRR